MRDERESGVVEVEPGRDLPVGHDEHVSHPGRERLHRPQRVPQLLVILEPIRADHVVLLVLKTRTLGSEDTRQDSDRFPAKMCCASFLFSMKSVGRHNECCLKDTPSEDTPLFPVFATKLPLKMAF